MKRAFPSEMAVRPPCEEGKTAAGGSREPDVLDPGQGNSLLLFSAHSVLPSPSQPDGWRFSLSGLP